MEEQENIPQDLTPKAPQGNNFLCPYVPGKRIPPGLSLINRYLMTHNIATIMAQITSPHPATSKKASGDDYGIPNLAGDLNSNPRAWLKNAEAVLKSFLVPQPNWVPKAAKHLKGVACTWYTN